MLEKLMKRFIAGNTPESALKVAKNLMDEGFLVDLNIIGENEKIINSRAFDHYKWLINLMREKNIWADISLKLTHFGSRTAGFYQIAHLAKELEKLNKRITIDMEDVSTDFHIYSALEYVIKENISNIGICLALNRRNVLYLFYLKETAITLACCGYEFFIPFSRVHRVCKGAEYENHKKSSFKNELEPRNNIALKYHSFYNFFLKNGIYAGLATARDLELMKGITEFVEEFNISKNNFEFQLLYGIRMDVGRWLLKNSYKVRIYVPFLFNESYKKALSYVLRRCSWKVFRALLSEKMNFTYRPKE